MADLSTRKAATDGPASGDDASDVARTAPGTPTDDNATTSTPVEEPTADESKSAVDESRTEGSRTEGSAESTIDAAAKADGPEAAEPAAESTDGEAAEPVAAAATDKVDEARAEASVAETATPAAEERDGPVHVLTDDQVAGRDTDVTARAAEPKADDDAGDEGDKGGPEANEDDGEARDGDGPPATEVIPAPRKKAARGRPSTPVLTLSVLLVVLVAAGVALFVYSHRISSANDDRALALASAKTVATNLTSISAQDSDAQINALNRQSTGAFKDQISQYAQMFQAVLKQGNVGSTSEITAAGIDKLEGDTATALVAVNAKITSSQVPDGQVRPYRMAIQLQRDGDHWLASNVEFVQ